MPFDLSLVLTPKQASDVKHYLPLIARDLGVDSSRVSLVRVVRRSIDARRRPVRVNLGVEVYVDHEREPDPVRFDYPFVGGRTPVVVAGGAVRRIAADRARVAARRARARQGRLGP